MGSLLRREILLGTGALLTALALGGASRADVGPVPRGPKKRLFVAAFESLMSFDTAFGGTANDALAAQLATVLSQMPEFEVVDRSDVASLQAEQGLNASLGSVAGIAQHDAEILGAQVIVKGYITVFDTTSKSNGLSIGIGGANLGGALGGQSSKGVLGMDIRLTDTTTGLLLGSTHIEEHVNARNLTTSVTGSTTNVTQQNTNNEILGQVTREAFAKAATFIRQTLSDVAWTGLVADVDGEQVFINIGSDSNVGVGDQFDISRVSRRIVDPASGELLGVTETPVGRIHVVSVQRKFSIGSPVSNPLDAKKGDIVRYVAQ